MASPTTILSIVRSIFVVGLAPATPNSSGRTPLAAPLAPDARHRPRCHELRIVDEDRTWCLVYRVDADAIIIAEVFQKATRQTPKHVIDTCRRRLRQYDDLT
ncbi:MAG TPA: type II toxin-antitoxin system RelE/ParE family toxin [Longimicrobiaceae bacterium]|nr:type II toxin-antitoxin system RelE/ParE family toxin [Longimicrobiaceae bacterium]